jgi:hypothetical protein
MKEMSVLAKISAIQAEKAKSIKTGEHVFHLTYYSGIIFRSDLTEYEKLVLKIGGEFSNYDKNGDFHNSLDSFTLDTFLVLSSITVQSFLANTINNASWDITKHLILKIWRKSKNKVITQLTSSRSENKNLTFGVKVSIDQKTMLNFKLQGDISEDVVLSSLDKIIDFTRNQQLNTSYKHPKLVEYNKKDQRWEATDVDRKLKKIAKEQIKNRKKSKAQD